MKIYNRVKYLQKMAFISQPNADWTSKLKILNSISKAIHPANIFLLLSTHFSLDRNKTIVDKIRRPQWVTNNSHVTTLKEWGKSFLVPFLITLVVNTSQRLFYQCNSLTLLMLCGKKKKKRALMGILKGNPLQHLLEILALDT